MKAEKRQSGLTLVEITVVIAVIALLVSIAVPGINALMHSFESEAGAQAMISAALAQGRAIAAKEQKYAGVRFQKVYDPTLNGVLKASQYMIFIVQDFDSTQLANGFRAADGYEPIKLPDSVGVIDLMLGQQNPDTGGNTPPKPDVPITGNGLLNQDWHVYDTTTFSVIFSPAGRLVIHQVKVRNRNGVAINGTTSRDDIFNTITNIQAAYPIGKFVQDDYSSRADSAKAFDEESSRDHFLIIDTEKFRQAYQNSNQGVYSGYLQDLVNNNKMVYINAYTGTIIDKNK